MINRSLITAILALFILPTGADAQKYTIDKVAAVVGNSIILYSDVEETNMQIREMMRERGYTSDRDPMVEALEELMRQKLLHQQALIDSVEINHAYVSEQVEDHMSMLLSRTGSVQELEKQFNRPIYDIRKEVTTKLEERTYAQTMRRQLMDRVTITPGEVERFFKVINPDSLPIIPPQYVYGQITKMPLSTEEAKLRAREQLLGLRERIVGGTRFEVLARMYSEDGSSIRGGELDPMPLENFEPPFAYALEKLRPGQVSGVVETVYGFHIIEMIGKQGNQYHAKHILIRPRFTDEEMAATLNSLDSVANRIREGEITFEQAAFQFSDDKYSKLNGGLASNLEMLETYQANDASYATTKHFKDDLQPDDFRALENLKPGEISRAFITTDLTGNRLGKVVKLIEILPAHPANMQEDYLRIEQAALSDKQTKELEAWIDKKISGMFVRVDPDFRKPEEFHNPNWLK